MPDPITIIDKTLSQHHDIKESLKAAGESLTDVEAQFMLRKAYSVWSQSSREELAARRGQLLQAITTLEQGLSRHFGYEEQYLPALCGEVLMKAVIHEHNQIKKQIGEAKQSIAGIKLEGLDERDLFVEKNRIQETINRLLQMVEEHSGHEETVLQMMRKGLKAPRED